MGCSVRLPNCGRSDCGVPVSTCPTVSIRVHRIPGVPVGDWKGGPATAVKFLHGGSGIASVSIKSVELSRKRQSEMLRF